MTVFHTKGSKLALFKLLHFIILSETVLKLVVIKIKFYTFIQINLKSNGFLKIQKVLKNVCLYFKDLVKNMFV